MRGVFHKMIIGLLAFATASPEAAYLRTLAQREKFGCSNRVASFVLPLGCSFNPRASRVVIGATLAQFNLPEAGLLLLLGIDHFLDMARSATNVIGDSVATAVVSKWDGQLRAEGEPVPEDLQHAIEPVTSTDAR